MILGRNGLKSQVLSVKEREKSFEHSVGSGHLFGGLFRLCDGETSAPATKIHNCSRSPG